MIWFDGFLIGLFVGWIVRSAHALRPGRSPETFRSRDVVKAFDDKRN